MHTGLFRGRVSMRGQKDEKSKKKGKTSVAERKWRKIERAEKRRKSSRLPISYPIPPVSRVIKRYRHACNDCPGTFVADSQEAFCRNCGSNALTITDVLENS